MRDQLVAGLESRHAKTRAATTRRIVALGHPAFVALRSAQPKDVEAARALERIMQPFRLYAGYLELYRS